MSITISASVLLGFILSAVPVNAATSVSGGEGLRVAPVTTNLTIDPGQSATVDIYVDNLTSGTVTLQALINDFVAGNNENGVPRILLNGQTTSHDIKKFIQPIGNVTIPAGDNQYIPVTIKVPLGTPAGGYYGVIRFDSAPSSGTGNVSLSASVGSLILVTVPGKLDENVSIASFKVQKIVKTKSSVSQTGGFIFTSSKDLNAVVRFSNQGNIQEQPFGKVELLNQSKKVLATYEINETTPPGNVLPGSIREFSVPLSKVGSFGKFTVIGNFGYGDKGQLLTAQASFYMIPLGLIILAIVVIILIVLAIIFIPKFIRSYNRKIERRAFSRRDK
jgi:hypothetical protein